MDQINPTTQPQNLPPSPPPAPVSVPVSVPVRDTSFPTGGFPGFQTAPVQPSSPAASVFSSDNQKKGMGKNIIVVGVLVLVLAGLVLGFDKARSFLSSAEGSCAPENLSEANLTPNSVEIVFQTGKTCQIEVAYGTSSESLLLQVPEAMASLNHRIRLSPLLPSTTYYYQVLVDGKKAGQTGSFLTKVASAPTMAPTIAPTAIPSPTTAVLSPTGTSTAGRYTFDDFQRYFGTSNATYDFDKSGMVNMMDWVAYQKTLK